MQYADVRLKNKLYKCFNHIIKYMTKSDPPKRDSIEYYKKKYGVSAFNSPKRTPNHPTKSHIVVVKCNGKIRVIRFGQQGVKGEGKSSKSDSEKEKNRRKSFKARHAKNIAKGKCSAAYWANKVKW